MRDERSEMTSSFVHSPSSSSFFSISPTHCRCRSSSPWRSKIKITVVDRGLTLIDDVFSPLILTVCVLHRHVLQKRILSIRNHLRLTVCCDLSNAGIDKLPYTVLQLPPVTYRMLVRAEMDWVSVGLVALVIREYLARNIDWLSIIYWLIIDR